MLIATNGAPMYSIANLTLALGWIEESKQARGNRIGLKVDKVAALFESLNVLKEICDGLDLRACSGFAMRSVAILAKAAEVDGGLMYEWKDFEKLSENLSSLWISMLDELNGRHLLLLDSIESNLLTVDAPFGQRVYDSLPSAQFDLAEAAKCLSVNRWTAAVFHMMRATELLIRLLARRYDVDALSNWNTALNQIEAELRKIAKSTHGEDQEQWAAEMAAHLRAIKNAWRNHVMHSREKYDEERANVVWSNVSHLFLSAVMFMSEQ